MRDVPNFTRHQPARGFALPVNRVIVTAVAAVLIVGGALLWRIGATAPPVVTAVKTAPVKNPAIDELVGTTKALDASQQQVVDQLQVMQDMLAAQQAEMKKTSDRVASLNANLESLRQSFASAPATTTAEEAEAPPPRKIAHAARPRGHARARRAAPARKTVIIQVKKQRSAAKR